ncbi:hypothetical protein NQ314_016914 [Rhamnusium bicolor]|uniref:Homing endonuclease LAGLIDADG domain-containing protein n=1 Tax=Rhamnusium bicolor TaxID=1586634 RepID=A0AAV8WUP6_9CUCU|nr:hypothetical protein NQ314_016914 [Rhamnusium bicolor]
MQALGNHTRQWDFLVRGVTQQEKRQITVKNKNSRRKFSRKYKFRINNDEKQICKTMFLNTLGISETFVTTALNKIGEGGIVEQDKRGKHNTRPHKNPEIVIKNIMEHIKLFPLVPSHYTRKKIETNVLGRRLKYIKNVQNVFGICPTTKMGTISYT